MKKKTTNRLWKILAAVAVVIAAVVILRVVIPKSISGSEETVTKGNIATYYSFSGSIEAKNRQTVYANSIQQIKSLKVAVGDSVEEGDTLYTTTAGNSVDAPFSGEILSIDVSENEQVLAGVPIGTH
jgi:HlyD family secretion protein